MTVAGAVIDHARLPDALKDMDQRALVRVASPETVAVTTTTARTKFCTTCERRVTVGTDGQTEFGHARAMKRTGERCPRRPDRVDPQRECGPR